MREATKGLVTATRHVLTASKAYAGAEESLRLARRMMDILEEEENADDETAALLCFTAVITLFPPERGKLRMIAAAMCKYIVEEILFEVRMQRMH